MEDGRIPIEELIEFPARYTFKAIGHHTLKFAQEILHAVQGVLGEDREIDFRTRLSSKAAYVSVSVVATVASADELHATYAALQKVQGVITVL